MRPNGLPDARFKLALKHLSRPPTNRPVPPSVAMHILPERHSVEYNLRPDPDQFQQLITYIPCLGIDFNQRRQNREFKIVHSVLPNRTPLTQILELYILKCIRRSYSGGIEMQMLTRSIVCALDKRALRSRLFIQYSSWNYSEPIIKALSGSVSF